MYDLYLLLGKEEGDKDTFIKSLEKDLVSKFQDLNKERFFLNDPSFSTAFNSLSFILDSLSSGNLFAKHNFYICYGIELLKGNEKEKKIDKFFFKI